MLWDWSGGVLVQSLPLTFLLEETSFVENSIHGTGADFKVIVLKDSLDHRSTAVIL